MHRSHYFFFFCLITGTLWAHPNRVYIYTGTGTDPIINQNTLEGLRICLTPEYDIQGIDENALDTIELNPNEIALIVIPGGTGATAYRNAIGIAGITRLLTYVSQGGRILGACAGAALFADTVCYQLSDQTLRYTYDSHLNLPKMTAYGPAIAPLYNPNNSTPTAQIASFHLNPDYINALPDNHPLKTALSVLDSAPLYWNGGCWFSSLTSQPTPQAHPIPLLYYSTEAIENDTSWRNEQHQYPAVILQPYGSGYIAFMGPHPELGITEAFNQVWHAINGWWNRSHQQANGLTTLMQLGPLVLQLDRQISRLILSFILYALGLNIQIEPTTQ